MRRSKFLSWVALVAVLALVAAACSKSTPSNGGSPGGQDLLAKVMASGVLRVATDPKYPPQSSFDQKTQTWSGFDVDVATEIAKRMGLQVQWETPNWTVLTAGNWNDRWDVSVGSMTPLPERVQVMDFTPAYYYVPAALAVYKDSTITSASQLTGKNVGSCGGCTYEEYLNGTLNLPGYTFDFQVQGAKVVTYDTDSTAIADLSLGDCVRLCAVFSSVTTLQQAIKDGEPIQMLGDPLFWEPDGIAVDKEAALDPTSFAKKLSDIVDQMHQDGTLKQLSEKWFGVDYSTPPATG